MENIIDDLNYRGLIEQYSNEEEVRELLSTPQTVYCGFDAAIDWVGSSAARGEHEWNGQHA